MKNDALNPDGRPVLVFDFDGTIADTHKYIIEISNRLAPEFNYKTIQPEDLDGLKDKTAQEIISVLHVPIMKIPVILAKAKREFAKGIEHLRPFKGLKEVLCTLKRNGVTMGILSSNSMDNIRRFLTLHEIDVFDFIHSTSKVFTKNTSINHLIERNGFSKKQILYIGDETRDIAAARRLGVKVAGVTWGYNSKKALSLQHPDFLINLPEELLQFGIFAVT